MAKSGQSGDAGGLEPITSELQDADSAPPEYEIATYPADFTLQVLHSKWKKGEIVVPKFQRRFVWKQVQASRLIESFLLGLPVPSIFLYTERKTERSLVIDGQQRLKSVFYFFEGYFGDEVRGKRPVFRLQGLHPQSRWIDLSFKNRHLASFVTAAGKSLLRRLKPEDLAGCLGHFGSEIKEIFGLRTDDSTAKSDYESILGYRHQTAHGTGAILTLKDLKRLYLSSLEVLEAFKHALAVTVPPAVWGRRVPASLTAGSLARRARLTGSVLR